MIIDFIYNLSKIFHILLATAVWSQKAIVSEEHATVPYTQIMLIHKVSIEKANRLFSNDMTGPPRIRHTGSPLANEKSHLDVHKKYRSRVITLSRPRCFSSERARRNILHDPESQTRYDATSVVEKNKIETGRLDEQRYRVFIAMERWARTVSVPRFLVFPAAANHAVEKCTSLLLSLWMTGRRDPGREPRRKKKRDKRSGSRKRKKKKKKGKRRGGDRSSIILQSGQDGRDSKPPVSLSERRASLGHNLQFLTIRLDQPPYKRTYYVTTLRQDSHERLDAR